MNAIRRMSVIMFVISLVALAVVAVIESRADKSVEREQFNYVTPICEHEDGSTQDVCHWTYTTPQGESRTLVNHNYGEWTFYPHTGAYITWDSDPSAKTVLAAVK